MSVRLPPCLSVSPFARSFIKVNLLNTWLQLLVIHRFCIVSCSALAYELLFTLVANC